ncbi:soluble lytic murein transglycosylase-like protein [Rhizorhapis suberifaciens]|uniref:Soluble lytic murein transglycosylase-like protein n=1 Tax=Rhizorhapis suberifaciens TaxID=13656 RepID=A0A840HTF8_9SPHN|nr:lytic transglycosylase domain-containing protein [Rhizorhapis suberifaciens]MBB4641295.1 soluble lytic murein transglycosylase-like protein [Rhizorhapis suberifaciens]
MTAQPSTSVVPDQLSESERGRYRAIFTAIRNQQWAEARAMLQASSDNVLRPVALAELYLAKNSPKAELFELLDLLNQAPALPQAERLSKLAQKRGAQILPTLPQVQKLVWLPGAPRRKATASIREDLAAQALGAQILPFIKNDDPAGAESRLGTGEIGLTPEALTEWRQRVAWSYYIENDDANARRMAGKALESGSGPWLAQAHWVAGLSAWRQNDCQASAAAFENVAARADNDDMRAAGLFWAARSHMACGNAAKVQGLMRNAARLDETFYGLLAGQTLAIEPALKPLSPTFDAEDWALLKNYANVRTSIALVEIGEDSLADDVLRQQARIGATRAHDALLRLARRLNLAETQLWLAHNAPYGQRPDAFARYPMPKWQPNGGWRVDRALVFAHALQESNFRASVVSPAGARGLMQVMPGTAKLMASRSGVYADPTQLDNPAVNMEYGQQYLERLRDMTATGGMLPKVIAAYNAGPGAVERWNLEVRDNGDPLLFIESIPYYETRAYVTIVMRNFWMYQKQTGEETSSLSSLAQGIWPRFPGMSGATANRLYPNGKSFSAD